MTTQKDVQHIMVFLERQVTALERIARCMETGQLEREVKRRYPAMSDADRDLVVTAALQVGRFPFVPAKAKRKKTPSRKKSSSREKSSSGGSS